MDKHFLYLGPDAPHEVSWAEIPAYGGISTGKCALADISHLQGCKIVVFVPGTEVLLTKASVPRHRRRIMLQSIPFALEENLCSDVEQLHFAIGPVLEKSIVPVAVVDREKMGKWLIMLEEAGLTAAKVVPATLAISVSAGEKSLVLAGDNFLLRENYWEGFAGETANLSYFLPPEQDSSVRLYVNSQYPDDNGIIPTSTEIISRHEYTDLIEILADGYREKETINLLQGEYSPGAEWLGLWNKWRLPITATLLICIMSASGFFLDYFRLKSAIASLDRQMKTVYLQTFPDSRKVHAPRMQMEQKLKALRKSSGGQSSFLSTYDQAMPLLVSAAGFSLNSMRFKNGRFEFDLEIRDLQSLDKLKDDLAKVPGIVADIKNAETKGNLVKARIQISNAGEEK